MGDLLGEDYSLMAKNSLYRCLDKLSPHKAALFTHLRQRWQDLFNAKFEILLYDLSSTYFGAPGKAWRFQRVKFPHRQGGKPRRDKRRFGYSRDKRNDCVQVVIALVITSDGFPVAYCVVWKHPR